MFFRLDNYQKANERWLLLRREFSFWDKWVKPRRIILMVISLSLFMFILTIYSRHMFKILEIKRCIVNQRNTEHRTGSPNTQLAIRQISRDSPLVIQCNCRTCTVDRYPGFPKCVPRFANKCQQTWLLVRLLNNKGGYLIDRNVSNCKMYLIFPSLITRFVKLYDNILPRKFYCLRKQRLN